MDYNKYNDSKIKIEFLLQHKIKNILVQQHNHLIVD